MVKEDKEDERAEFHFGKISLMLNVASSTFKLFKFNFLISIFITFV